MPDLAHIPNNKNKQCKQDNKFNQQTDVMPVKKPLPIKTHIYPIYNLKNTQKMKKKDNKDQKTVKPKVNNPKPQTKQKLNKPHQMTYQFVYSVTLNPKIQKKI